MRQKSREQRAMRQGKRAEGVEHLLLQLTYSAGKRAANKYEKAQGTATSELLLALAAGLRAAA